MDLMPLTTDELQTLDEIAADVKAQDKSRRKHPSRRDEVVVFETTGGGVSVLYPAPHCRLSLEEIIAKDVPAGCRYKVVSRSEVGSDRYFRDAWRYCPEKTVTVDLPTAKEIQRNCWRKVRQKQFIDLDIAFNTAMAKQDFEAMAAIEQQKQALRDVTLHDMTAKDTTDSVRAVWPEVLGPRPKELL